MNPIVILARAKALIAKVRKWLEVLKKIQSYMKAVGGGAPRQPQVTTARPRSGGSVTMGIKFGRTRFVLNHAGIRALLQSEEVGAALEAAARAVAPPGTIVSRQVGRTRQNVRIADESDDALDREAKAGHLSRALGQVRL